ncbi:MAG: 16S rRNA (cytidine(1402)-2'-O)-methyltransferase [Gemmatimonas sp.]
MSAADQRPAPGLHLVATPIGNLGDISARAIQVLKGADAIACEDTRVTGKLTHAFGIATPLLSYHEHNAERMRPRLLARLRDGERIALVSDAGTPLVSDPGYKLVREAAESGISVFAIPGASAALAALIVSGLPTDRFFFQGFLPAKAGARRSVLAEIAAIPATLIVFEAARRLGPALAEIADVLGDREAAVGRELTKLHEEVRRGPLSGLAAHYEASPGKGEAVIVIAPPGETVVDAESAAADIDARLRQLLATVGVKEAATAVALEFGIPRRDAYARALALRESGGER